MDGSTNRPQSAEERAAQREALDRASIIPAEPGWFTVDACLRGDGTTEVSQNPIIAWLLQLSAFGSNVRCGHPQPITADGLETTCGAVVGPTGHWTIVGVQFGNGGVEKAAEALIGLMSEEERQKSIEAGKQHEAAARA